MNDDFSKSLATLTAAASLKPELSHLIAPVLSVVRTAAIKVADAEKRAQLAEEAVAQVRPELDKVVKRAEVAEAKLAQREEQVKKAAAAELPAGFTQAMGKLAKRIGEASQAMAKSRDEAVELLTIIHRSCKDRDGKSPLQNVSETARGPWKVRSVDGDLVTVAETRAEAVKAVLAIYQAEKKATTAETDPADTDMTLHRPTPWRKKPDEAQHPDQADHQRESPTTPPNERDAGPELMATDPSRTPRKRKRNARIL